MPTINLPNLYKRTNTGAIQQWSVAVTNTVIVTTFGQVGGKLQTTKDTVKSGKNAGKRNETGAADQALKEAKSQWMKKKKAGYVETLSQAQDGETDAVITGGILPMLAKVYEEHTSKVKFPVAVQPKLDGHRCIAMVDAKCKVTLWTRTRKPITSVPHIVEHLEYIAKRMELGITARMSGEPFTLDGELYNHDLRNDFEKITSATRKKEAGKDSKLIQYHVYDMVSYKGFKERISRLDSLIAHSKDIVIPVETEICYDSDEVAEQFAEFKKQGYEGAMVRLFDMPYENKRSHQLLKVKSFVDAEFEVVGIEEGRGKLQGHAGAFVCKTSDGKEFRVKMSGATSKLKEYWENPKESVGHSLTVQFQGVTSDGIPRFPVGIRFREDL